MVEISSHAIVRAMERLPGVRTEGEAIAALDTPAVRRAVEFGAKYVRLGTGQRIVLENGTVTTVLPCDTHRWKMGSRWDRIRSHARGWARFYREGQA